MSQEETLTPLKQWDYSYMMGRVGVFFIMTKSDFRLKETIMRLLTEEIVLGKMQESIDLDYIDPEKYETYDPNKTFDTWGHSYNVDLIVALPPGVIFLIVVAESGYVLATLYLLKLGLQLNEDLYERYKTFNNTTSRKTLQTIQEARDMLRKQRMKGDMRKM
jgi:hypothetical protein